MFVRCSCQYALFCFHIEGAFTGRNVAWDRSNNNHSYSRHLHSNRKQSIAKKSTIHVNIPGQDGLRRPKREARQENSRYDSGVSLDRLGRHESIEELFFDEENKTNNFQSRKFLRPQQEWKSEFVICATAMDSQRSSKGGELDVSSLSLNGSSNRKTFSERIRGF